MNTIQKTKQRTTSYTMRLTRLRQTVFIPMVFFALATLFVRPIPAFGEVNLVANGSFELPVIQLTYEVAPPGFLWSIDSGSIDLMRDWQAGQGDQSIDLNGVSEGTITQTLTTIPGQQYVITFLLSGNPDIGGQIVTLDVTFGSTVKRFTFDTTGKSRQNMGWTEQSFTGIATSAQTDLSFVSYTHDCCWGPALDAISVVPSKSAFSGFNSVLGLKFGPKTKDDSFNLTSEFRLAADSNGVDPLTEDVSLQVGAFSTTIPAGSFTLDRKGCFTFEGEINHVKLKVVIHSSRDGKFKVWASGAGADLTGTQVPLTMGLTIGDDEGNTSLANGNAKFKNP